MKEKNDLYISLLRFGRENLLTGTTREECSDHLKSIGFFDSGDTHQVQNFDIIFNQSFSHTQNTAGVKHFITPEAYFNLLEYEELKEARGSASFAKWTAIIAILLSLISALISIYFSVQELRTPITIDTQQLSKIENTKFDSTFLNEKLREVTENQKNLLKEIYKIHLECKN